MKWILKSKSGLSATQELLGMERAILMWVCMKATLVFLSKKKI